MIQNKEIALAFLRQKLSNKCITKAFIFGSFITDKENPNDCDIFIVTNKTPSEGGWKELLKLITLTKIEFCEAFGLPLFETINTEKEFTEYSAFRERILKKKTIDII